MAYVREIPAPKCKCGKRATRTIYNKVNAPQGNYCTSCAAGELSKFQKREDDDQARAYIRSLVGPKP